MPILKKPKLQKIIVITEVAILIAAKNFTLFKCPIRPVSTKPANGMAILEKKIGMDNWNKYNFEVFVVVFIMRLWNILFFVFIQLNNINYKKCF